MKVIEEVKLPETSLDQLRTWGREQVLSVVDPSKLQPGSRLPLPPPGRPAAAARC
jgi:hypothetical protein